VGTWRGLSVLFTPLSLSHLSLFRQGAPLVALSSSYYVLLPSSGPSFCYIDDPVVLTPLVAPRSIAPPSPPCGIFTRSAEGGFGFSSAEDAAPLCRATAQNVLRCFLLRPCMSISLFLARRRTTHGGGGHAFVSRTQRATGFALSCLAAVVCVVCRSVESRVGRGA